MFLTQWTGFRAITACAVVFLSVALVQLGTAQSAGSAGGDAYEEDNTPSAATVFNLLIADDDSAVASSYGILPQHHDFHPAGDEDWIKFYGVADGLHKGWYSIKASNVESGCDIVLELYDTDGETLLATKDSGLAGEDEYIDWQCRADGIYYVRCVNYEGGAVGAQTGYDLAVYWPIGLDEESAALQGSVSDNATGSPIAEATVQSTAGGGAIIERGSLLMAHPAGLFSFLIKAPGYEPVEIDIDLASGQAASVDVALQPISGTGCLFEQLYGAGSREVRSLRLVRDRLLNKTAAGRLIIRLYDRLSPAAAAVLRRDATLRNGLRAAVGRMLLLAGY